MKKLLLTILTIVASVITSINCYAEDWNPKANEAAVVVSGRARFTVLTPEMIRIQYSTKSVFEDRASFAVVNRNLPVPEFTTEEVDGYLYIKTSALTLCYKVGGAINPKLYSSRNLKITFNLNGEEKIWYPGKDDALNLLGTSRTLDGDIGDTHRVDLENGLVSRDGWAVIDESPATTRGDGSRSLVFDDEVNGVPWVAQPADPNALDWYFLAYGHDYKKALGDYVKIAGRQPMPPLYMFGYWYSKYQRYTTSDFTALVNEMEKNKIPHDVMIYDMDWHLDGWTGWTWNKQLIPNPVGLNNWMHNKNLKIALNLHPADGVSSHEDGFAAIKADMGDKATANNVPWMLDDKTFYKSLFKNIIRVRESEGVDFWWLDWQQDMLCPRVDGLGWTFWLNHVFYNDMKQNRTDRRPVIFHRWGGMGSHRYPIGFSGDTYSAFPTLEFEPYYTATASNVCFGYWGHDLGGHLQITDPDGELYLRWLQYGVFTPIFRTHGASQWNCERRIWKYDNFPLMLDAVNLRYELVPYIYTCAREAYDTGVSICRPLYYEWPEENWAYNIESEYYFGNDILVSPIAKRADKNGKVQHKTWLPKGKWYDMMRHTALDGNKYVEDTYGQQEIPYFVKQGSIIPCNPHVDHLKATPSTLVLKAVGGADGEGRLYEDDGDSESYKSGAFSTTHFTQQYSDEHITLTIEARVGTYPGMANRRAYEVQFLAAGKVSKVSINGNATTNWKYNEALDILTVSIPETSCDETITIDVDHQTMDIDDTLCSDVTLTFSQADNLLTAKTEGELTLYVMDVSGNMIMKQSGENTICASLSTMPDGTYLCSARSGKKLTTIKILKY